MRAGKVGTDVSCDNTIHSGVSPVFRYIRQRACGWLARHTADKFGLSGQPKVVSGSRGRNGVSGNTAAVRDHTETVMAMLVGGEVDSVDTVVWEDAECMLDNMISN